MISITYFLASLTPRERRHTRAFLNFASEGLSCLGEHMENINPRYYHGEKIARLCRRYPGEIRGLKLRISGEIAEFSGTTSFDALRAAVEIADKCGLPVSVHMPAFQGSFSFTDVRGVTMNGSELLRPCATMLEGEWVFNDMPYRQ